MNCPCCGGELKKGFIQCRDGLYWTPKRQLVPALSVFGRGSVALKNGDGLSNNAAHALHCIGCGMVLIPRGDSPLLQENP